MDKQINGKIKKVQKQIKLSNGKTEQRNVVLASDLKDLGVAVKDRYTIPEVSGNLPDCDVQYTGLLRSGKCRDVDGNLCWDNAAHKTVTYRFKGVSVRTALLVISRFCSTRIDSYTEKSLHDVATLLAPTEREYKRDPVKVAGKAASKMTPAQIQETIDRLQEMLAEQAQTAK